MSIGEAPGKVILLGEHAVVHGHPALAVPVNQLRARAEFTPAPSVAQQDLRIEAPDIGLSMWLREMSPDTAIPTALRLAQSALRLANLPAGTLHLSSAIPVASGMGSGAAVTLAIVRALSALAGVPLPLERQSQIVFEVDKIHHGTPSGIDNTVITYGVPIRFQRDLPPERLHPGASLLLLIADSGVASPTRVAVGGVRERLRESPVETNAIFQAIHTLVDRGTAAVKQGRLDELGSCMAENHIQLSRLGVSLPALDRLVQAASLAGAHGAKLSGAGLGGNVIALVSLASAPAVAQAVHEAGAVRILQTEVAA